MLNLRAEVKFKQLIFPPARCICSSLGIINCLCSSCPTRADPRRSLCELLSACVKRAVAMLEGCYLSHCGWCCNPLSARVMSHACHCVGFDWRCLVWLIDPLAAEVLWHRTGGCNIWTGGQVMWLACSQPAIQNQRPVQPRQCWQMVTWEHEWLNNLLLNCMHNIRQNDSP